MTIDNAPNSLPKYLGIKLIAAEPMTRGAYNEYRGWQLPENESAEDAGYLVEYLDGGTPNVEGRAGYVSWSPKEQFDKAYRSLTACGFSHALYWLQTFNPQGAIQRQGWNGKGLVVKFWEGSKGTPEVLPYLVMEYPPYDAASGLGSPLYPQGCSVPWLASQTDILADDWTVIG